VNLPTFEEIFQKTNCSNKFDNISWETTSFHSWKLFWWGL